MLRNPASAKLSLGGANRRLTGGYLRKKNFFSNNRTLGRPRRSGFGRISGRSRSRGSTRGFGRMRGKATRGSFGR